MINKSVSVVIRTKNESKRLKSLLEKIKKQKTISNIEIVVVDTESTDNTPEVIEQYGAKRVTLKQSEFTYPISMNAGVSETSGDIVILTVAHALPISHEWIASALKHFEVSDVAGVFGPCLPDKAANFFEKTHYWAVYLVQRMIGVKEFRRVRMGIFGATNIAIRKDLWNKHNFDERYEMGGEDGEWARWAFRHGYKIIREPGFVVRHSHNLGPYRYLKQLILWSKMKNPMPFDQDKLIKRY